MTLPHPIVADVPGVRETVRLLKRSAFEDLPVPWPRCQDLPTVSSSQPEKDDFVVAVSHAWSYQAHPDPLGEKCSTLRELTEEAIAIHRPRGRTLFFVDFLSTPQRPFASGQAPRTAKEDDDFAAALKAFPLIYLMADATLHVDVDLSDVPNDLQGYTVEASKLRGVELQQVGPTVQVMDFEYSGGYVAPFDVVSSVGNVAVTKIADVDRFRNASSPAEENTRSWFSCTSCRAVGSQTVLLRRAPYGRRNTLPANVKGWIFLERFVSMVKAAMVPESRASSVAFSNSDNILKEIFQGGARLRAAAAGGKATLRAALQEFARELDTKQFSATSMDKVMNTGGVGGVRPAGGSALDAVNVTAYAASERDVVWELMLLLVRHLEMHWEVEAAAQRQRQLILAVCRGDVASVTHLIEAGAKPNEPDAAGRTALHAAASFRHVEMVRTLLQHRTDTTVQDKLGNLPIHLLSYMSQDSTVDLFNLLAPSRLELAQPNVAGISPLKKLATWVEVECHDSPFPPAKSRLAELRAAYPDVLLARTPGVVTRSSLRLGPVAKGLERQGVGARSVSIPVWEPTRGGVKVHVLFLALQWPLPWSLAEKAVGLIAESICDRFGAKLWAITQECLDGSVLAEEQPLARFHDDLEAIVRTLPLGERFYWLDSSGGMAVPVLWRLPDRIRGALIVDAHCFFSEEFEGSQMHTMLEQVFAKQHGLAAARDPEKQAAMCAQWSTAHCYEDMEHRISAFKAAWAAAPKSAWLWWGYVTADITALWRCFWRLPVLPALPVTFAVGSLAPPAFTTEPLLRFQRILPNSKVAYIPDSKILWELEDEEPVCKVASLLYDLIDRVGEPEHVCLLRVHL